MMAQDRMIISIGRECGSGGHEIGEKLAEHYGIKLYDRNLIEELAKKSGLDPDKLHSIEEKVTGNLFPVRGRFNADTRVIMDKMTESDRLYLLEKNMILELAEKESFVIVGRAANAILADDPNTLKLYVYAKEEFKVPRVREYYHLDSEKEARKQMQKIDKIRSEYFNYYSDQKWGSSDVHDFMIDSSLFGIDKTVDIIIRLADMKFGISKAS